jgi:hypothetical protein
MRKIPFSIATLCMLSIGSAVPLAAQPARDRGPCEQITAACQGAGFAQGGVRAGTGLLADCIVPIMQGTAQPRQARNPPPQVDPRLVADCKASNPRFGRGSGPPSEPPAQPLPASPPSPPATLRKPQPQASAAGTERPCASTDDSLPSGLVVVLPPGTQRDQSSDMQALNNPFISGVALQIDWRDIEPVQGKPDWSRLDELFAAAETSKKWVQLLIFPGFFSPAWALEGAETDLFSIQYGPGGGEVARLPMPWDGVYLGRWFVFLKQLSDRYGKSPAFRLVAAAGPTSVSAEMSLPVKPEAHEKWLKHSYTPRKYLEAWDKVFQVYAEDFPNQCVSLSAPGLPMLEGGRVVDPAAHMRARQEIIQRASGVLGRRLAIQWSDLHAGRAPVEAPDQTELVISYSGRIITGLQMRGGSQGPIPSKIMGAEGNPPLALRRSIDKGMAPNKAGQHINYLEIYEGDVLANEMQPVLEYAASLFHRKRNSAPTL